MAIINGTPLNNTLNGANNVVDTIDGLAGNDVINGGTGADTMIGGLGNDTFTVDSLLDVVIENAAEGTDVVKSAASIAALWANIENASLTGSVGNNIFGNALSNSLFGNSGANILDGGGTGEVDFLSGLGGNDTFVVDNVNDVLLDSSGFELVRSSVNWTLANGFENLTGEGGGDLVLTGNAVANVITGNNGGNALNGLGGNDVLVGGTGGDNLDGGTGADNMTGGDGGDSYTVDNVGDAVNEAGVGGTDTVNSSISHVLGANVENLQLLLGGSINGTGNALNNVITGNTGNNVISGMDGNDILSGGTAGNDQLIGGAGTDYYLVNHNGVTVLEVGGDSNQDTVETTVSFTLGADVENLLSGAGANDYIQLTGNSLNNVINNTQGSAYGDLYGLDGDDTITGGDSGNFIDGGTGADTMTGGASGDQYVVDNAGDSIIEALNSGYDYVYSTVSYTMADNLEELYLQGNSNINGIGNALSNYIEGNSNVNLLLGGDGDDNLNGRGGADIMIGGIGSDGYNVDNVGDSVVENAGEGSSDSVYSTVSYTLGSDVENLFLNNGAGNINATGNAGVNYIYGNEGDNIIDGAGSASGDYMQGGDGNDVYHVRHLSDTVFEFGGEGTDTVQQYIDYGTTVTLFNDVENLVLNGTVIFGGGNGLANNITGNAEDNTIDGFGGADIMIGGAGNDYYVVDNASDLIIDSSGTNDQLFSSASYNMGLSAGTVENGQLFNGWGNTNLTGNSLVNVLTGSTENNTLNGGVGADTMIGNGGTDAYVVDNAADSVVGNGGGDTIFSSISWDLSDAFTNSVNNLTLTGAGNNNATGNDFGNNIFGNSGNNQIDGGLGADNMSGGGGDDTFAVDNAGDVTSENFNEGNDTVNASVSHTIGNNIEALNLTVTGLTGTGNSLNNTITGFATGASVLFGMGGDDNLIGGTGDDTFDGGTGADFMVGYNGDNTFFVDQAGGIGVGDYADNGGGTTNSVINSTISWNLSDGNTTVNVNRLNLTGTGTNLVGTGTGGNDFLNNNTTGINSVSLIGGSGTDVLTSTNNTIGASTTFIIDSFDTVTGTALGTDNVRVDGTYALGANVDNLVLLGTGNWNGTGNALGNSITGNSGNNSLNGGLGPDVLIGLGGDDYYVLDQAGETVIEAAGGGTDTVELNASGIGFAYTLANEVENGIIAAGPDQAFTLFGNGLNNTLTNLNSWNGSTLNGAAGADNMIGGGGDDFFVVDNVGDSVTGNGGIDHVTSSVSYALSGTTENLTITGAALNAVGNGLSNILIGNNNNNQLDGVGGGDSMAGGLGNDTYFVNNVADVISEGVGEGTDMVFANTNYTMAANLENMNMFGGSVTGVGNSGNNIIQDMVGNNNTLNGGGGADSLIGGNGNDYFIIDGNDDTVSDIAGTETVELNNFNTGFFYTLGTNIENGIIGAGPDVASGTLGLFGNSLNNTLTNLNTSSGTVSLDGGAGQDTMIGSANADVFVVDDAGDNVTGNGGADNIRSSINWDLQVNTNGVTNLLLLGANNLNGFGTAGVDGITGNSGNNTLDGRGGVDLLAGMGGNDTYIVDNGLGEVFNGDSGGIDTVISTSGSLDLSGRGDLENATVTDAANSNLTGNANVNILTGDASNNAIDGLGGADTMNGGDGNDVYYVDDAGDTIIDSSGASDLVYTQISYTLAAGIEQGTATASGITLTGNGGDNALGTTVDGNTLDGGAGADQMLGSVGNDTFAIDNVGDSIAGGGGLDTIRSSITWDLSNVNSGGARHLVLTGAGNINATGNGLDNSLTGNSGNNSLDGGSGTDAMAGLGGNDTYFVDNTGDTVTEIGGGGNDTVNSIVNFTLGANLENLILSGAAVSGTGNGSNNNITGNANANTIDGGGGADAMTGGDGDDFYTVDNAGDQVFENFNEGTDTVSASATHTMGANVENLFMTGVANIDATGNTLNNTITGNDGNNSLDGGAGTDVLTGGLGDDTYAADSPGDVLNENDGEGTDTVVAGFSATLQDYFENLTLSGVLNLNGTGNSVANNIFGNSGNNSIDGAGGADNMFGGGGDDTFFVDDENDFVGENFNQGNDTVNTLVNFTLGANVENLFVDALAASGLLLQGNGLDNLIDASQGTGMQTLNGFGGADQLIGAGGDDLFIVDNAGDNVTGGGGTDAINSSITWNLNVNSGGILALNLIGGGNINGSGNALLGSTLTGNGGVNTLTGGDGEDSLDGMGGNDRLVGGLNDDDYFVDSAGDVVIEANGGGSDNVFSTASYVLSAANEIENLTLLGVGNLNATGNGFANILSGNAGNNTLNGGTGADILIGNGGNDLFIVDNAGDNVFGGAGVDTVNSTVNFDMNVQGDINIDNLVLLGTALNGTGNVNSNNITGNASANVLNDGGVGGNDVMTGLGGNDTYVVNNSGAQVVETATGGTADVVQSFVSFDLSTNGLFVENLLLQGGADIIGTGNVGNNVITGNTGANQLFGLGGNDILNGGLDNDILDGGIGKDTMTGGAGQDTFHFSGAVTTGNADIITAGDFTNGPGGDILDVSDILQGYNGNVTEYVQITNSGANTIVKVDVNGLAGPGGFITLVTLNGVSLGNDEAALVGTGNLVVT